MSINVANCPRCGRIFAKSVKNLCPECAKEEEDMYEKVYSYLRENPKSTVQQVSEHTGVPEERILSFLRQDRIMSAEWTELTYPCERCGADINSGRFCDRCNKEMQESLHSAAESIRKQDNEERRTGYHTDAQRKRRG